LLQLINSRSPSPPTKPTTLCLDEGHGLQSEVHGLQAANQAVQK